MWDDGRECLSAQHWLLVISFTEGFTQDQRPLGLGHWPPLLHWQVSPRHAQSALSPRCSLQSSHFSRGQKTQSTYPCSHEVSFDGQEGGPHFLVLTQAGALSAWQGLCRARGRAWRGCACCLPSPSASWAGGGAWGPLGQGCLIQAWVRGLPEGGGGLTPCITGISEEPGKADEMLQSRHVAPRGDVFGTMGREGHLGRILV